MATAITLDEDGNNAAAVSVADLAAQNATTPVVVYNATGGTVTVRVTAAGGADTTVTPAEVKINGGNSAIVNVTNSSTTTDHSVSVAAGAAFTTHRTAAAVGLGRNTVYIG